MQSSSRGSHTDSTSLGHSLLGCGEEVLADVGLHLGVVLPGEGAVRLDDVGAVLLGEGDFTVVAESGTSAVDPYRQIVRAGTRGVRASGSLVQRKAVHRLVGLPEASISLGVRSLSHKENFLHPGGTPVSRVGDLPTVAETGLDPRDRNLGSALGDAPAATSLGGCLGGFEKLS